MTETDLYEILGVGRNATDEELKRAYRQKAREHHPDANHGEEMTEDRFKEVSLAYEVLRDPERRAQYDRYGAAGVFGPAAGGGGFAGGQGDPFGGGLGDLFDAFFNGMGGATTGGRGRRSGPMPGPDAEIVIRLSFREAVFGLHREVTINAPVHCDTCEGTRRPSGNLTHPLSRLPGRRGAPAGPAVDPRPGGDRGPLRPLPGDRTGHRQPVRGLRW